jgi:hypothetical protein
MRTKWIPEEIKKVTKTGCYRLYKHWKTVLKRVVAIPAYHHRVKTVTGNPQTQTKSSGILYGVAC